MPKGREPAATAEAQRLVSDNLELDADTFEEPDDADAPETDGETEPEADGEDESPQSFEEQDEGEQEPGPDALDDLQLREPVEPALPREREAKFDKKGNIIDVKTGKVIASAGPAARFYQEAYRAKQAVVVEKARATDLNNRLARAIEIGTAAYRERDEWRSKAENPVAKQLGLSDSEVLDGLQLVQQAKNDPKGALQKLLTRAAANGIDISSLGINGTEGLAPYMTAMREEIARVVQPITEQQKRERETAAVKAQQTEVFERTKERVTRYFEDRPDQVPYMPIYQQILQNPQFANMSLGEIGARIEMNLLRQRFEGGGNRRVPQNPGATTRSRPNGRSSPSGPGPQSPMVDMAPVTDSYDAILKPIVAKYYKA